ncbi:hypothetical protein M2323_003813 [Rhodoblastus acidophilus]|uniref:hypothetical protein n=1 Tax=Rhodoblastus acidophilus TaxID=1074 RepID=UPI00161BA4A9|nr:hypothetical protein [Rhodoblastus acidophilus]MCW2285976.1 hypothetical protein [Rhodoblastus acidophilus]MCW2334870.1 hypothetical protein [Rhodoblastus acidophilus]
MDSSELFRSCANEHVAAAALMSLGGALVERIDRAALPIGVTRGAFVANLLAEYDRKASPELRKQLVRAMSRAQMPILAGLRHVLQVALRGAFEPAPRRASYCRWRPPVLNWAAESASLAREDLRRVLH